MDRSKSHSWQENRYNLKIQEKLQNNNQIISMRRLISICTKFGGNPKSHNMFWRLCTDFVDEILTQRKFQGRSIGRIGVVISITAKVGNRRARSGTGLVLMSDQIYWSFRLFDISRPRLGLACWGLGPDHRPVDLESRRLRRFSRIIMSFSSALDRVHNWRCRTMSVTYIRDRYRLRILRGGGTTKRTRNSTRKMVPSLHQRN